MTQPDIRGAVASIKSLPTLPAVVTKILATVADADSSAVDLGSLISADPSLSASLLKIANSAYFGFPRQIESLTTAIVTLGYGEIRKLVLAATAFRNLSGGTSNFDRARLWRHSLATAMACERLAKDLRIEHESCFAAGLLHDIGKVAFDKLLPNLFEAAARRAQEREEFLRDTEMAVFGFDHATAGALLAVHWNLPAPIVEAIRRHHAPYLAQEDPTLTNLVAMANYVTYRADLGDSGNAREAVFPDTAATALGVFEERCSNVSEYLGESQDQLDQFLGALGS